MTRSFAPLQADMTHANTNTNAPATAVFPRADRILLGITIIWGSTFSVTKNALHDIAPLLLQGTRFALAALIVGIYTWKDIRATSRRTLLHGVILGAYLGVGFALQTIGLGLTSASKSGFLTGTLVVFTPLLHLAVERRLPKWTHAAGVLIVGGGLYVFTSPSGSTFNSGDLLVLLCAVVFAFHVVYLDVYTKDRFRREIVFWQFVTTSAIGFVLYPVVPSTPSHLTLNVLLSVLYLAIFASAFAIFLLTKYQRETSPTHAAIIYTMEPVMAALIAWLALGEILSGTALIGAGIMLAGLLVSELSPLLGRSVQRA
jgi:drug/metabolite transporter (DMT)-like permease